MLAPAANYDSLSLSFNFGVESLHDVNHDYHKDVITHLLFLIKQIPQLRC